MKLIRLVHEGGSEKVVECHGMDHERAFIFWPIAGQYDVTLADGILRTVVAADDVELFPRALPWRVHPEDLELLRDLFRRGMKP